jgi:hypothetical protein
MAGPHLSVEHPFFQDLQRAFMVTVLPDGLILTTSDQTELVFKYR